MYILGISCYFHDASAALLKNGVLIAAAEEERFSRIKHDYEFPEKAIEFCLAQGGITGNDLEYVVFFEKPFVKMDRLLRTSLKGFPKTYGLFVQSMRTWLMDKLWIKSRIGKSVGVKQSQILFSEHHLSHAASAFYCSPFENAAVLTFDGVGEWSTTTMGEGKGNDLRITKGVQFPHSIGLLYSAFTAFLGFEVNEGEYKVMGMAPYGQPRFADAIWKIVRMQQDGTFWLDPKYFSFHYSTNRSYTSRFVELFGEPRDPNVPFFTEMSGYPAYYGPKPSNMREMYCYNQRYADLAASIQLVTEEITLSLARELHRRTGQSRLCLAGGVALNSVANRRILMETPFEELYIQPSAGDGGGALGAALVAWHCALGNRNRFVMDHAYWGQGYGTEEIQSALDFAGARYTHIPKADDLIDITVDGLMSGDVIGWFQGRFEWGPRALGNRSIIADPRNADMKDTVNNKIKFREPFRPFAPSVLSGKAEEYFDVDSPEENYPFRFMLLVVPVRDNQQENVPAISHLGTARIQTVHAETNSLYHGLIQKFDEATGIPLLLNTSFNVKGEPIVNTPYDALRTFGDSGLDTLVLGNFVVHKR